jgi:hypothetical protein
MMKSRILFPILVMSLISFGALGQAQLSLGIKAGANFSKIDPKAGTANIDNATGWHAGAFGLVKILMIGVQPEVQFSKQGSSFTFDSKNYEANFDYINVPILLKFYLPLGLNLQAGPQFGFLSVADLTQTATGTTSTDDVKDLFTDTSDIAIAVGAGWDLPFGLTVDFRYNIGMNDMKVVPPSSSTTPPTLEFKNKVIQLSIGYKLIKLGGGK